MKKYIKILAILPFGVSLFLFHGCTTGGCGSDGTAPIVKSFTDSIKIPLSSDSTYLFVNTHSYGYPDTAKYEVTNSDLLTDSILVTVNITGLYLYGNSIRSINNVSLHHDSVLLSFDYMAGSNQQKTNPTKIAMKDDTIHIECTPAPETFIITHAIITLPKNKSADSLGFLQWKIK